MIENVIDGDSFLFAIRHGQSVANEAFDHAEREGIEDVGMEGRDADVPLSTLGRKQADNLRLWFKALPGDVRPRRIFVSPYLRARQTLDAILGESTSLTVQVDARLRDRETGSLELMTPAAVKRLYPEEALRRQRIGEIRYRPPGGESLLDVGLRVRGFLEDLPARGSALVVGHDATVLMIRAEIEGLTEEVIATLMTHNPVRNASVSCWKYSDSKWVSEFYNDINPRQSPTQMGDIMKPFTPSRKDENPDKKSAPYTLLGNLHQPFPDMEAVQNFDATVDRINRVVALLTARLTQENAKESPNQERIENIQKQRDRFISARQSLSIDDTTQITKIRQECLDILRGCETGND